MDKTEKIKRSFIIVVIIIIAAISMYKARERRLRKANEKEESALKEGYDNTGNYNVDIIKKFHAYDNNNNYLISPYNIEIALNMLREGSDGKTKEELDKVLGTRTISDVSVKDKIGVANAIFIKDEYKNNVKDSFYSTLKTKYNSDVIYDSFTKPDKINNWVKDKTDGMIDKILDSMSKDYVMGLASALAIDVKWLSEFECTSTKSGEFTKLNNEKINVEMMHKNLESNDYKYFKNDEAEGIIIPYRKEDNSNIKLEFVGILPNNVDDYIKNLTKEKLDSFDKDVKVAGSSLHINLALPRFKYDFEAKNFKDILKELGIKEAFDPDNANFTKMVEIENYNVYVGEAIHKTHIELNEKGTKAAAITYFGMYRNSAMIPEDYETINIEFNKPFVYMIRESNTKEILFFGTIYEPNLWNGSTCENK